MSTVASVSSSRPRALLAMLAIMFALCFSGAHSAVAASSTEEPADPLLNAVTLDDIPDMTGTPLLSAWPKPNFELWQPPRQGRLQFAEPIDTATLTLTLTVLEGAQPEDTVTRLTKGDSDIVKFSIPVLEGPGSYKLTYQGKSVDGEALSGTIAFSLAEPFVTVGGGNHRHSSDAVHEDSSEMVLLRTLFVWAAAFSLLSVWRQRVGRRSFTELVLPRIGGLLLAIAASWQATLLIIESLEGAPDSPLLAALASPGLWIFVPLAGAGLLQVIAGRRDTPVAIAAAAVLLSVVVSTGHSQGVWGALQSAGYALVLLTAAGLIAALIELGARLWAPLAVQVPSLALRVLAGSAVLSLLSLLMLVLHAHGFTFNGDFAEDLTGRLIAAGVLCSSTFVAWLLSVKAGRLLARLLGWPVIAIALAASSYLLWLPPPASGL